MDFTKEQLSDVFIKHLNREKGLQELMELMIESMMQAERRDFLLEYYFETLMFSFRWPDVKSTGICRLRRSKNLDPE